MSTPRTTSPSRAGSGSGSPLELTSIIDQAADGRPTLAVFFERLERGGVTPIPSVNVRGLNGMSYRYRETIVKGSDIGRAYTARGLQDRKAIAYLPERDSALLQRAINQARIARPDILTHDEKQRDFRGSRRRDQRTGLNEDQKRMVSEIGRFRTVSVRDLIEHHYGGNDRHFDQDLRVLTG